MAAAPGEGGLHDDIMETMAFFNSDSMDKDYLLEGNTSIPPLTSSFFTIPFEHIHGSQEDDNVSSLLPKHHTLNTPAPTPHCRTESFSSRIGQRKYQSTREKLVIDTDSHDKHSVYEFTDSCRALSPRSNTSSKLRRATRVHNLCEKKRRNRINEKIKDLQHLIPNSTKTHKASILDDAIKYVKKLQFQVERDKASILNEANEHIKKLQHQVQILSSPNKMDPSHICLPMGVPFFQMPHMCMNMGSMGMGINMSHSQWNNGCMAMPQGVQVQTIRRDNEGQIEDFHIVGMPMFTRVSQCNNEFQVRIDNASQPQPLQEIHFRSP